MNGSPEPTAVTLQVVGILERLGVRYAIGGSFASSVHGVFRATVDADVVADLQDDQVAAFVRALGEAFYVDEGAIRRAVRNRKSFNVIHHASMFKVDVFIPRGRAFDESQLARRTRQALAPGSEAFVASAEDTILAKLDWYRSGGEVSERQWRDVLGVLEVQRGELDVEYLRRMALSLGVSDLLERALVESCYKERA